MGVPQGAGSPFKQGAAGPTATAPRPGVPLPGAAGANSSGKIQLAHSLENIEESGRLEPGEGQVAYVEYVEERAASTGSQGIHFHLKFVPGPGAKNPNRTTVHSVYVTPRALWKVKNSFCAVGQCEALAEFDMRAAENVMVLVDVTKDSFTPTPTEQDPDPKPRDTYKADTIRPWPDDKGGPGFPLSKYLEQVAAQ